MGEPGNPPLLLMSLLAALAVMPPLHAEPAAANARITLRHGALVNLDMSAMTMAFRAQPPELLKAVKVSDAVKFHAGLINGTLTVTAIQAAP
jgi:Cu(I)/Ag(I) efflux system protein CusF